LGREQVPSMHQAHVRYQSEALGGLTMKCKRKDAYRYAATAPLPTHLPLYEGPRRPSSDTAVLLSSSYRGRASLRCTYCHVPRDPRSRSSPLATLRGGGDSGRRYRASEGRKREKQRQPRARSPPLALIFRHSARRATKLPPAPAHLLAIGRPRRP